MPDDAVPDEPEPLGDFVLHPSGASALPESGTPLSLKSGDALPEDLDVTAYVGPYVFPDIRRRRIAGSCYIVIGVLALWAGLRSDNPGLLLGGVAVVGSRRTTRRGLAVSRGSIRPRRRGCESHRRVPGRSRVGAQLGWRGLLSRPGVANPRVQRRRAAQHPRARGGSTRSTVTCSVTTPSATPKTGRSSVFRRRSAP